MPRDISSSTKAMLELENTFPFIALEIQFDTMLRIWSGQQNIQIDGDTYYPTGELLSIEKLSETQDLSVSGLQATLSGISTNVVTPALTESYQGNPIKLYFGLLNGGTTFAGNTINLFNGILDTMEIVENGKTSTVTITAENRLVALGKTKVRRYTDYDQKADYSSDKGFEFVTTIAEKSITWGESTEQAEAP